MKDSLEDKRRIIEAIELRFDEIESDALHQWNRLDSEDQETRYTKGFLDGVKYIRREYRRTLSEIIFGK